MFTAARKLLLVQNILVPRQITVCRNTNLSSSPKLTPTPPITPVMSDSDAMSCSSEGVSSHPIHYFFIRTATGLSLISNSCITMPPCTYQEVPTLHINTNTFSPTTCNNAHSSIFGIVPPITQPVKLEQLQKQTGQNMFDKN